MLYNTTTWDSSASPSGLCRSHSPHGTNFFHTKESFSHLLKTHAQASVVYVMFIFTHSFICSTYMVPCYPFYITFLRRNIARFCVFSTVPFTANYREFSPQINYEWLFISAFIAHIRFCKWFAKFLFVYHIYLYVIGSLYRDKSRIKHGTKDFRIRPQNRTHHARVVCAVTRARTLTYFKRILNEF